MRWFGDVLSMTVEALPHEILIPGKLKKAAAESEEVVRGDHP